MKDCCKNAFLLGLKHVQEKIKESGYLEMEELRAWLHYSIKLLENVKEMENE